jgi:hypothetical protein
VATECAPGSFVVGDGREEIDPEQVLGASTNSTRLARPLAKRRLGATRKPSRSNGSAATSRSATGKMT